MQSWPSSRVWPHVWKPGSRKSTLGKLQGGEEGRQKTQTALLLDTSRTIHHNCWGAIKHCVWIPWATYINLFPHPGIAQQTSTSTWLTWTREPCSACRLSSMTASWWFFKKWLIHLRCLAVKWTPTGDCDDQIKKLSTWRFSVRRVSLKHCLTNPSWRLDHRRILK